MKLLPQACLFVPGDSERKLAKATASAAGTLIIDLEDSIPSTHKEHKAHARSLVAEYLQSRAETRQQIVIRCNAVESPEFLDDLHLLKAVQYDSIMLPKCESSEHILCAAEALPGARFIALIETALGVHQFAAIATAHPRVTQAAFGSVDFALDLGVDWTAEGTERRYAMSRIALESRALRLAPPIDAVFPNIDDQAAFERDALTGMQLGYGSKMVIHPRQVDWLAALTSLHPEEEAYNRKIVAAYEAAIQVGTGAVNVDGVMVDLPVYERARRRLGILP